MAVAGQTGQVVHKRVFGARQAVEQGRFADVRAADKGDGGFHDEFFLYQVSVRKRTCNTSRCFSKHGRLKRIRGRLKIDSTEQWLELEFPSHTAIFDLGNLPALINFKYGMASFIRP